MSVGILYLIILAVIAGVCILDAVNMHINSKRTIVSSYASMQKGSIELDLMRSESNRPISSKSYEEFMQQGAELIKKDGFQFQNIEV